MSDYELKYSFDYIGSNLFGCTLTLINENSEFTLACDNLEYYVQDDDYKIYKNGSDHIYDSELCDNEILELIKKLENREFPISYDYTYRHGTEIHDDLETFDIQIDKNKTKVCNATVNTSEKLTQSIINFFKDILREKCKIIIEDDSIYFSDNKNDTDHNFFLDLYNSEYSTDEYKKKYDEKKEEWISEEK
jgi:hypothetical protein